MFNRAEVLQGGPPSVTAIDKVKYRDYIALLDLDYLQDVAPISVKDGTIAFGNEIQKTRVIGSNTKL